MMMGKYIEPGPHDRAAPNGNFPPRLDGKIVMRKPWPPSQQPRNGVMDNKLSEKIIKELIPRFAEFKQWHETAVNQTRLEMVEMGYGDMTFEEMAGWDYRDGRFVANCFASCCWFCDWMGFL